MNIDIKLHKEDLPDQIALGDNIAVDCEFMGLNVERIIALFKFHVIKTLYEWTQGFYNGKSRKILLDKKINKIFHFARADIL